MSIKFKDLQAKAKETNWNLSKIDNGRYKLHSILDDWDKFIQYKDNLNDVELFK